MPAASRTTIERVWAMPSAQTFAIPPIAELLTRWLRGCAIVIDPFCGQSVLGSHRNDLASGQDAESYVHSLDVEADAVLFDPPYSPRQISEVYRSVGLACGQRETQNGGLYKRVKDALDQKLALGGIAICCGWNSAGFGVSRRYEPLEILLVCHGGAHQDTIVTVERKVAHQGCLVLEDSEAVGSADARSLR